MNNSAANSEEMPATVLSFAAARAPSAVGGMAAMRARVGKRLFR